MAGLTGRKRLGTNMVEAMRAAGMNQRQLAEAVGVSQGAVSLYVNGRRDPSIRTLLRICDAVGRTPDQMLDGV